MSLKITRRRGSSMLYLHGTVLGQKVRESTGTGDRHVADQIRIKRESELTRQSIHGKTATRTFADAAGSYLTAEPRTAPTALAVRKLLLHFRDTPLARIGQDSLDGAFEAILTAGVAASPATKVRAVITPLQAILEHAAVLGWCAKPAFKKPRIPKTSTSFLLPHQADALIAHAAPHLRPLLTFLIGTGCRMSEALELDWSKVDLHGARATVWQKQGNERRIDLPGRVLTALRALPEREGAVFRPAVTRLSKGLKNTVLHGESYRDNAAGGGQIKSGWAAACRAAGLPGTWREWTPKGSAKPRRQFVPTLTPHDCRHTWASAHYAIHRDLLKLKADGGWGTVAMCERYCHMMPSIYGPQWEVWLSGGVSELRSVI